MKAILISIKPKYVADILNGKKTIEIRKTMPKCDLPIEVYIYCTKAPLKSCSIDDIALYCMGSGKVVAKFTLNKVEEITPQTWTPKIEHEILEKSCLKECELFDYVCSHDGTEDKPFYVFHINDLEIFDRPKELSEFKHTIKKYYYNADFDYKGVEEITLPLTKAPQNFCYVEVE